MAIVGLALVLGLWLLGYHLTGKRAFLAWKAERVAMGDRVDWKELVPPPVAPEQNFAEAPIVRGAVVEKGQMDPRFKSLALPKSVLDVLGDWREGRRDPLEVIAKAYGKPSVEMALKPLAVAFADLEEASRRPASRFPINYEEGEVPALLGFRGALRTLRVRAMSHLRSGRQDQALQDLQTCLRIADHLKREPHLLSALLRIASVGIAMQVVWEGVEDRLWEVRHLEVIQLELARIDLLDTLQRAWQAERQNYIAVMSATAENRPAPTFWEDPHTPKVRLGALGRGWFYRNMLVWCQFASSMVDSQDPASHRVLPHRRIDPFVWLKDMRFRKDLIMAQIALPALTEQVIRVGQLQALVDQAGVACALERHRLERGAYPEGLEVLSPAYLPSLPHDLVTGGPLRYRRAGDAFTLYQMGWNGKDDRGQPGWSGEGKDRKREAALGDWAWPHAVQ
ncbi:MAG: hypothetical protein Q8K67_00220 [Geothrix sp.]|nr:hypothetical protein [Geothrix sp.]